jgi:hypothetical protein
MLFALCSLHFALCSLLFALRFAAMLFAPSRFPWHGKC